jgi:hypothetical protein
MKKGIFEKIQDLADRTPAVSFHQGVDWNGYEVFELDFEKNSRVGLPWVILVKGEEVRLSTPSESFEYLDYSEEMDAKSKSIKELKEDLSEKI